MPSTVLVVEDESAMRQALHDKLSLAGFTVTRAANGAAGLELALRDHPDLILTDILMPRMHGLDMIERLRLDDWGRNVPIIILSNLNDMAYEAKAVELRVPVFVIKSDIKLEDLLQLIHKQLKQP